MKCIGENKTMMIIITIEMMIIIVIDIIMETIIVMIV